MRIPLKEDDISDSIPPRIKIRGILETVMKEEEIVVHTDGGARGNPGPSACAFVAEINGKIIQQESSYLGTSTNNYAEYQGVLLALKWLVKNFSTTTSTFYLDSELVVRQLNGIYKVKDKKLIELFDKIKDLSKSLNYAITYKHIPRTQNKIADFLVNKELDGNIKN